MEKPLFVKTSKGWINLAQIWHIIIEVEKVEGDVHFCLDGESDVVIPMSELGKIHDMMMTNGLFLKE